LYTTRLKFAKLRGAALVDRGSTIGPKNTPALFFPILAGGSRSRGGQTGRPVHRGLTSLAHLLTPAQVWLTHSSGYSSNGSGPKTGMENVHVEIPISINLLHSVEAYYFLITDLFLCYTCPCSKIYLPNYPIGISLGWVSS
jgi:hypothetical protein